MNDDDVAGEIAGVPSIMDKIRAKSISKKDLIPMVSYCDAADNRSQMNCALRGVNLATKTDNKFSCNSNGNDCMLDIRDRHVKKMVFKK